MKKEKVGLIIFLIGAIYMTAIGWLSSWWITATLRDLTLAQINETIWAVDGAFFILWSLSIPLGALFAGVGFLLYTGSKGSRNLVVRNRCISHNIGGSNAANTNSLSANIRHRRRSDTGILLWHTVVLGKAAHNA